MLVVQCIVPRTSPFHSDSVFLFDDLRICIYVYYISYLHSMDTFRLRLSTVAVKQISGSCLGEVTHSVPRILAVTLLTITVLLLLAYSYDPSSHTRHSFARLSMTHPVMIHSFLICRINIYIYPLHNLCDTINTF